MNKRSFLLVVLFTLAACGDSEPQHSEDDTFLATPATGGLAAYDLNGDGIVYQDGMHPQIVQDEPGLCPICSMELMPVPVSGGEVGVVEIDPVTLQNIGVRTAMVETRALERDLRTTGTFEANDAARTTVTLKVGGWVEDLYVNVEGQRVRRGQPLLALYSPDLVATQQEYLLALRNRELLGGGEDNDRLVEAARTRMHLFEISDEQIEQLERTREVQRTLTLYAPASGTVVEKRVVEGMQANPGQPLMEIVNLSQLWLQVAVPEHDLSWVHPGTRAEVSLPSDPGVVLTGRVDYIYDSMDLVLRTGTARVTVSNPGGRIKPGMYAIVNLYGALSEPRLSVPSEAVIRTGDEAIVIVALAEGRFRPQPVAVGEEADGYTQILSGLAGGERVVTSAQFLIDSEARLAAAIGSMSQGDTPESTDEFPEVDHSQMDH
ncbi:MAG: efflux RND transporter periplasmic adaptor subunit [Rubricoccaceae bacterium]|nr:efflux RND transporter periplasmic adaptor subunit [Rubricoccaceae bacterium]